MFMALDFEEIVSYSDKLFDDLKRVRRYLHQNPELGRKEFKTSAFLQDELRQSGFFDFQMVSETGFCVDIIVDEQKSWIAIRGDIDALPIPDKKDVPYRSHVSNICHACGHDFHATVILGVAKTLQHFKHHLRGNVRFIFQHAEELTPGGAIDFVNAGKLKNIDVIFGFHADPNIKVGQIRLVPGWITAQSIYIKFTIQGPGGHSARPSESSDPIFLGTLLLNELYSSLYRLQKPESPFVFTIGKIKSGENFNSIATSFIAEGTLRVTDSRQGDQLLAFIKKTINSLCKKWQARSDFFYKKGALPVINDPDLTKLADNIIKEIINKENIINQGRSLGGEDFAEFIQVTSGLFIRVGVGSNKHSNVLHSSFFDIDEKAIPFAVSLFTWLLINYFDSVKRDR
jgi:amidohydrolase